MLMKKNAIGALAWPYKNIFQMAGEGRRGTQPVISEESLVWM
jgi:hypothetical protein